MQHRFTQINQWITFNWDLFTLVVGNDEQEWPVLKLTDSVLFERDVSWEERSLSFVSPPFWSGKFNRQKSLTTSVSHKTFSLSRTGRNDFYTLASLEQWEVTSQRNSSDNGHSVQPINNRFFLFAIWFIYYCTFLDRGNQYNCVLSQINCTVWFREPYSGTKKQRESLCSRLHFWLPTPSTMSSNKVGTQQQA